MKKSSDISTIPEAKLLGILIKAAYSVNAALRAPILTSKFLTPKIRKTHERQVVVVSC